MQKSEQNIEVLGVEGQDDVHKAFQGTYDPNDPKHMAPIPLEFVPTKLRYFNAEHTVSGGNIVIHFYVSENVRTQWKMDYIEHWWLNDFATNMSTVAQEHFEATVPRILAKYTHEAASWWFKAQGYDYLLDVAGFLRAFYERLDETIHSSLQLGAAAPVGTA